MIKFSFKTFIRYILMALAFSLVSMLISSFSVKAAVFTPYGYQTSTSTSTFHSGVDGLPYWFGGASPSLFLRVFSPYNTNGRWQVTDSSYLVVDICMSSTGGWNSYSSSDNSVSNNVYSLNVGSWWCNFSSTSDGYGTLYRYYFTANDFKIYGTGADVYGVQFNVVFHLSDPWREFTVNNIYWTDDFTYETDKRAIEQGQKLDNLVNLQSSLNNKQDETNDKLDDLNDNLTNSDTTESNEKANSFFENFEDKDYGLSDVISMPLSFVQKITSGTCTPLSLPLPFVKQNLTLPCMNQIYSKYFGDFLKIYQSITFGLIAYAICINIFATIRGFKNPEEDKVEVLDL